MSLLYLEEAKRHIAAFSKEDLVIVDHRRAMDCFDCEAFLQLGIDAFEWLTKADRVVRAAVLNGLVDYDASVDASIEQLFRTWLVPCKKANQWVKKAKANGHVPENLAEFQECELQVRAMVKFLDNDTMTDAIRELRDQAISENDSGKTAEFV